MGDAANLTLFEVGLDLDEQKRRTGLREKLLGSGTQRLS
jgi:hypothetical protein